MIWHIWWLASLGLGCALLTLVAFGWFEREDLDGGPAQARIVVAYGFWIFLLSDIIMFPALFAPYAVLSGQTAGGPSRSAFLSAFFSLLSSTAGLLFALALTAGSWPISMRTWSRHRPSWRCGARSLVFGAAPVSVDETG